MFKKGDRTCVSLNGEEEGIISIGKASVFSAKFKTQRRLMEGISFLYNNILIIEHKYSTGHLYRCYFMRYSYYKTSKEMVCGCLEQKK